MTKTCRQGRLPTTHLLRCQNIVTYGRLRFYSSTDPFIQFVSHSRKKNKRLATATGLRRATAFAVLGQSPDLVHNFPITLRRAWCRTVVFVRVCVCVRVLWTCHYLHNISLVGFVWSISYDLQDNRPAGVRIAFPLMWWTMKTPNSDQTESFLHFIRFLFSER